MKKIGMMVLEIWVVQLHAIFKEQLPSYVYDINKEAGKKVLIKVP